MKSACVFSELGNLKILFVVGNRRNIEDIQYLNANCNRVCRSIDFEFIHRANPDYNKDHLLSLVRVYHKCKRSL